MAATAADPARDGGTRGAPAASSEEREMQLTCLRCMAQVRVAWPPRAHAPSTAASDEITPRDVWTRCLRCDGIFHAACVAAPKATTSGFTCAVCYQKKQPKNRRKDLSHEAPQPLMVPSEVVATRAVATAEEQVIGVGTALEDGEESGDDDDWQVFKRAISVCSVCREVNVARTHRRACAMCCKQELHSRCIARIAPCDASRDQGRQMRRKRKRAEPTHAAATTCELCDTCGRIESRMLTILVRDKPTTPDEYCEACVQCQRLFCLHALEGDDEDEDVDLDMFGQRTDLGWECRRCLLAQEDGWESEDSAMILLCDGCNGQFDMTMLNPPLQEVPQGDWFCDLCTRERSRDVEMATILICDGCDGEFDMSRLQPPMTEVPKGRWFCASCHARASAEGTPIVNVTVIICDGCDSEFEIQPDGIVPDGDWFCDACTASRPQTSNLSKRGHERLERVPPHVRVDADHATNGHASMTPKSASLLTCNDCGSLYDASSLGRSYTKAPKDRRICPACSQKRLEKKKGTTVCVSCDLVFALPKREKHKAPNGEFGAVSICEACRVAQSLLPNEALIGEDARARPGVKRKRVDTATNNTAPVAIREAAPAPVLPLWEGKMLHLPLPHPVEGIPLRYDYVSDGTTPISSAGNSSGIYFSEDEGADVGEEFPMLVCDLCLNEFDMAKAIGEGVAAPPRPWYCYPCLRRVRKTRKKRQRASKQMLFEMEMYGGLLRPTAAKVVDPLSRALGGKKPRSREELLPLFELVGKRVGVFLQWDKHWVIGRVVAFEPSSGKHLVRFDDDTEQSLPLFSFPLAIGTSDFVFVKAPAVHNEWWPAQVLALNPIAKKMSADLWEDEESMSGFRLVSIFAAGSKVNRPVNVSCWVPKHLCRSMSSDVSSLLRPSDSRSQAFQLSMDCVQREQRNEKLLLIGALKVLLASTFNDIQRRVISRELVGYTIEVDGSPDLVVKAYHEESGLHTLAGPDDVRREINIFQGDANTCVVSSRDFARLAYCAWEARDLTITSGTSMNGHGAGENLPVCHSPHQSPKSVTDVIASNVCIACGIPPALESSHEQEEMVNCSRCGSVFHSFCCDPPHGILPLVSEDDGQVIIEDVQAPFVCSDCAVCSGCGRRMAEEAGQQTNWCQWRLPLRAVSVCDECVSKYEDGEYCAVCACVLDNEHDTETPWLFKCSTCSLWVHPSCEPDARAAFARSSTDFELGIDISLENLKDCDAVDDEDDGMDDAADTLVDDAQSNLASGQRRPARQSDETFARKLEFRSTYDAKLFHDFECFSCRQVRMLKLHHRLMIEDKLQLFKDPVTADIAPTYFDIIKNPMDLMSMRQKIFDRSYVRIDFGDIRDDFELLCLNAVTFNSRERDFLIWREAWRFYGQGKRVFAQVVPKSSIKQRGGKYFDALVLAAKRQLPNSSIFGKQELSDNDEQSGESDTEEQLLVGDLNGVKDLTMESTTSTQDATGAISDSIGTSSVETKLMSQEDHADTSKSSTQEKDHQLVKSSVSSSERKPQRPMLAPVPIFTPQAELGTAPKPYSSIEMLCLLQSRVSAHLYCWLDLCAVCASGGATEHLLFCLDCGECFHSFCVGVAMTELEASEYLRSSWRCPNCQICELCGKPEDPASHLVTCSDCHRSYHGHCLRPALNRPIEGGSSDNANAGDSTNKAFYCGRCIRCKTCEKSQPASSYTFDQNLCMPCRKAKQTTETMLAEKTRPLLKIWSSQAAQIKRDADKCPMCHQKWTTEDAALIQCDCCELWAHPQCDPLLEQDSQRYQQLFDDPNAQYICGTCRSHERDQLRLMPDIAKCQVLLSTIQRQRLLCDARWKEDRKVFAQAQQWRAWQENVAVYLYVLRLGEECLKAFAFTSVSFTSEWSLSTKAKELADRGIEVPAWLVHKAARYLRFKRYAHGPRAMLRHEDRVRRAFYSQQGVDRENDPSSIYAIVSEAVSCSALLACVQLLHGWRPLQRIVLNLLEPPSGEPAMSAALIQALQVTDQNTMEDEMTMIKKQYELRIGGIRRVDETEDNAKSSRVVPDIESTSAASSTEPQVQDITLPSPTAVAVSTPAKFPRLSTTAPMHGWANSNVETSDHVMSGPYQDNRFCVLCFVVGDSPQYGRLLQCDLDQWAHANCVLWSSDVFEDKSGFVHKCQRAIARGRNNVCDACGVLGATVGCCISRCTSHYHFPCALQHGVAFLPSNEACCTKPSHLEMAAAKLERAKPSAPTTPSSVVNTPEDVGISSSAEEFKESGESGGGDPDVVRQPGDDSFAITEETERADTERRLGFPVATVTSEPLRSLLVDLSSVLADPKKRFTSLRRKRQVCFRVGALTVHSLGHIVIGNPSFSSRDAIFPLGFRSSRIFWSGKHREARCLYECVVSSTDVEERARRKERGEDLQHELSNGCGPMSIRPVFKITPSDDREHVIVASTPDEALMELRSRVVALYESHDGAVRNPFLTRTSWFSYGLLGSHFFGCGLPSIAEEIEALPHAASVGVTRNFVLQMRRRATRKRRRNADALLASMPMLADERDVYVFSHHLPTASEWALAQVDVEHVITEEEQARLSSGSSRTDGLEREDPEELARRLQTLRRRLNKDATREVEALPVEKAAGAVGTNPASGTTTDSNGNKGVVMDVEHLPIAMQYREMRRRPFDEKMEVRKSKIHGYGLFTKEKFVEGQMIVEYQGQMISQDVADSREKTYEEMGLGSCYMFRLDAETIIDATQTGNLARFINHSCDPKAFARVVSVEHNEKKIVIFAKRTIEEGDEVTYDYKFPIEDEAIRCDCGAPNCIGRMN